MYRDEDILRNDDDDDDDYDDDDDDRWLYFRMRRKHVTQKFIRMQRNVYLC